MIKMIKRAKKCKIRTKLSILILISGILCILLFWFLWHNRWNVWDICTRFFPGLSVDYEEFYEMIQSEAQKYELPESEDDKERTEKLEPFFALLDDYTSIYLYGTEDGLYRAGQPPKIMFNKFFRPIFDTGYVATGGDGEDPLHFNIEFKNENADAFLSFYHRSRISYPWFLISVILSILTFLTIILFFVNRKIKHIISLKEEVLLMASGDLNHPVPHYGEDEIGILSNELDHLRLALNDNIRQEQESRKANQDLITALSHDLRTPLTILNGYLEVLKLKRSPEMQEEYLNRCLQKTGDIKEMTDRMFEYALVSEENETTDLLEISTSFAGHCLQENCDYIRLTGFQVQFTPADSNAVFLSDKTMLKRIFNNLFSNILKYGDKKNPVCVTESIYNKTLEITISNTIKQEHSEAESNHIGLKSVEKMMTLIGGEMNIQEEHSDFTVRLIFHLL